MNRRLRFTRQTRLPEIGEGGQERLSNATVAVSSTGFASEIESRYLSAAGITVSPAPVPVPVPVPDLGLTDPAARDVAQGALHALVTLRSLLESS